MRIAIDARLTARTPGGISHYIRRLARGMPALDPDHRYRVLQRQGHAERLSDQARRIACWSPPHHPLERTALGVELLPHRLDLLHSPDFIPPQFGYRRSVITVHDLAFLRYPQFLTAESRRYYNDQIEFAVRRATRILSDSHSTRIDLQELLGVPAEKIDVVHLGVNEDFRSLPIESVKPVLQRLRLTAGYVLFVGTFEPRKNLPGLLQAIARLRARAPDTPPLVLVGHRGWLSDSLTAQVDDLRLTDHVHVIEGLPAQDLPAIYNGASLLALPSHYEGFGFPVLEAMACGVPAVIADRASLPELAGEAALRVDPDDPESIADAMGRLLADSALRDRLRSLGFERVRHFGWDATLRKTLETYRRAMA